MPITRKGEVKSKIRAGKSALSNQTSKAPLTATRKSDATASQKQPQSKGKKDPSAKHLSNSDPLFNLLVTDEDVSPCKICNLDCLVSDKAISCYMCESWIHASCSNLTKTEYDCIEKINKSCVKFFCEMCEE